MNPQDILNLTVSFQPNSWSDLSGYLSIGDSLSLIKKGTYGDQVKRLRNFLENGERATYDKEKKKLPAVTFSASFNERRNRSSILLYNEVLTLDIDKLEKTKMESIKRDFMNDSYIIAFWESPSGVGIKGLIHFTFPDEFSAADINFKHNYGFRKVSEYFLDRYSIEIDAKGNDVTRLCFFSQDSDLFLRNSFESFPVYYNDDDVAIIKEICLPSEYNFCSEPTKNQKFNPKGKNKQADRSNLQAIIKHLSKRNLSITANFSNWYQVAYAIANTFTYELGLKYFLALSKMDGLKFDQRGCINMLNYCYANSHGKYTFATIVHFAKQVGYKEKKEVPKVAEIL